MNWNNKLITAIIMLLLINTFVVKNDFMSIVAMVLMAGAGLYWNRQELKKFKRGELAGIACLFIVVIVALACLFLFVANPVVNLITVGPLRFIAIILIIIAGLALGLYTIQLGMKQITKGRYPFSEDVEQMEMPENEVIQQLIDEGKVVQAIKVARETYGYSLLEAKKYIDSFITNQ